MPTFEDRLTITDQLVSTLRDAILRGKLEPGKLYSVYKIADEFGVSRTPVREAMLRLADAGMVRFERNRGFRVLRTSARELQEVFQLRLLLEVPAAARAAMRANEALIAEVESELDAMAAAASARDEAEFMSRDRVLHELILAASDNKKLVESVRSLRFVTMTLGASTVDRSRSLADILVEHRPIVVAIAAHDSASAAAAMRYHIIHTGTLLLNQLVDEGRDSGYLDPDWVDAFPTYHGHAH
ncbi:MAG: GntR family transcriptional regulator [Actinomycetota bacterium]|nr:GntR family transcriptional regulator [Actinomycetota bacterium]